MPAHPSRAMTEFGLIGKLTARPGQRDALVANLLEAADHLRGVEGCRTWLVQESAADPDAVWITEVWRSRDDHAASLAVPAIRGIITRSMPLLAGPPEGHELRPRGGVGA